MRKFIMALSCALAGCVSGGTNGTFGGDGGTPDVHDLAGRDLKGQPSQLDLTMMGLPSGTVGVHGGKVSRMLFGVTGDTRPANCDDNAHYPAQTITQIFSRMNAAGVQFALATGDHQYVCSGGYTEGVAELTQYAHAQSTGLPGKVVFPTMGNHECNETMMCPPGTSLGRFRAYEDTLLAPNWSLPYYSFDVATDGGLARFIVAADTAWDSAEATWLQQTLDAADSQAKYVFLFRHYPLGTFFNNTQVDPGLMQEESIIKAHRTTMLITGHTHEYKRNSSGTQVIMGLGGAPLTGNATYFGYLLVEQQASGNLSITVHDAATGNMTDAFTVSP